MARLSPPATMKTPVRAALRGRPGPASQEPFSEEHSPRSTLFRLQPSRMFVARSIVGLPSSRSATIESQHPGKFSQHDVPVVRVLHRDLSDSFPGVQIQIELALPLRILGIFYKHLGYDPIAMIP